MPEPFAGWFAARGWTPRPHQLAMLGAARANESVLLIAPTGGGKTLAGFLPSLIELHERPREGIHTLYVSPLKALATDIARNLTGPSSRWGSGSRSKRAPAIRQRTGAAGSESVRPTSCSPRRKASLCCSRSRTHLRCFAGSPASSWTKRTRWPAPSEGTSSHSAWPVSPRSRPARAGSACPPPSHTRRRCSPIWAQSDWSRRRTAPALPSRWCCRKAACRGRGIWHSTARQR